MSPGPWGMINLYNVVLVLRNTRDVCDAGHDHSNWSQLCRADLETLMEIF